MNSKRLAYLQEINSDLWLATFNNLNIKNIYKYQNDLNTVRLIKLIKSVLLSYNIILINRSFNRDKIINQYSPKKFPQIFILIKKYRKFKWYSKAKFFTLFNFINNRVVNLMRVINQFIDSGSKYLIKFSYKLTVSQSLLLNVLTFCSP